MEQNTLYMMICHTPSIQKQNTYTVGTKAMGFSSTLVTQNWSVSQHLVFPSSPSKYFRHQTTSWQPIADDDIVKAHAKKLNGLKKMLLKNREDKLEALLMVDVIQRLGIEYHFQEEIESILKRRSTEFVFPDGHDVHDAAIRFRLLRQEGLHVPAGMFNHFNDENGNFTSYSRVDLRGLLALYEASQLSIKGEEILDKAKVNSFKHLNSSLTQVDDGRARLIWDTLDHPHHKSLAKFTAKNSLALLQDQANGWTNEIKLLAKFEFMIAQCQHQHEIEEISKWWKDLGLSKKLKFARDQPLKWYIWSSACLADPKLTEERIELTKPISFIYLIDDIFDVYGTLDEVIKFTEVVNRWDMAAADHLPECMKICMQALDNVTDEISYRIYRKHGWNPVDSLRKSWASLCNAFLVEAKWFASGDFPKAEVYLKNGIVSSGVHVVLAHIFFLLGPDGWTRDYFHLVHNNPTIISSTAMILRLCDDLESAEDEDQDGHDGSYIKYYMNEHKGSSLEAAKQHVRNLISDAWKQLNQECLHPNPFSSAFAKAALNLARMVPLMYNYDHNHRLPTLDEFVNSLLYETVFLSKL